MVYINRHTSFSTIDDICEGRQVGCPSGFVRTIDFVGIVLLNFFTWPVGIGNVISVDIVNHKLWLKIGIEII